MNSAAATPHKDAPIERWVWEAAGVVVLGSIMSILDTTIVNVGVKTVGHDLNSPLSQIQWVITGYMLSLAAVIPLTGWAARRFGAKRLYLVSLVLFTGGSALCGLASSAEELIFFRVLQGVGGGMIMPVGQMILARAAGPQRMGRVMSVTGIPTMLAPIFGPAIGGLILDSASWHWMFYVNVPIGIIAWFLALRMLPGASSEDEPAGRLDVPGVAMMVTGLPLMAYGIAEIGATNGFSSPRVVVPLIAGTLIVILFIFRSLRIPNPLLELRLYRRPTFASASAITFCLGAALFGTMIVVPLYYQGLRGQSVVDSGLLMAPQGLGMAFMMPVIGRMTDRYGGGPLALGGVFVITLASLPFALIGAHTAIAWLEVTMLIRGIGIGFAFMPAFIAALAALGRHEVADGTPQLNVLMRVGGSLGTVVLSVVLARALAGAGHSPAAQGAAYGTAFWWSLGMSAVAIVPAFMLVRAERGIRRDREPAERVLEAPIEVGV
jgi:EmrB/QacA subfamily drug resistance transporter